MKYLLHILGVAFVAISTLLGIFLVPLLLWLFESEMIYLLPFVLSIIMLSGTILWLIIKRKDNYKSIQFILLYLSLGILLPNSVSLVRFESNKPKTILNCFYPEYRRRPLYSKFGIVKRSDWADEYRVTSDLYGNRYIVAIREATYVYSIEILDSNGEYVETIPVNEEFYSSEINNYLRYHGYQ